MAMFWKIVKFYARYTPSFTVLGYWWRSLFWSRLKPDFTGQTWLVTGASGGLGRAIADMALEAGATVIAAARNPAKLAALGDGAGRIVPMAVDFASQADTERFIGKLREDGRKIDVLVNNVGILNNEFELTSEGREASFATNILTHFMLTERLIAGNMLGRDGVVINMSSGGMYNAPLMVGAMNVTRPEKYRGVFAYAVHKRGQVELTKYWQTLYGPRGLHFYVMHPGWAKTAGVARSLPRFYKVLNLILRDGKQGGETAIWLAATKPSCAPGAFWFDRKIRAEHVYPATRNSKDSPADLADYLRRELQMA